MRNNLFICDRLLLESHPTLFVDVKPYVCKKKNYSSVLGYFENFDDCLSNLSKSTNTGHGSPVFQYCEFVPLVSKFIFSLTLRGVKKTLHLSKVFGEFPPYP